MSDLTPAEKAGLRANSQRVGRVFHERDARVVAFSLVGMWATLDNGAQVPVTNMFDAAGQDTEDPDLCVTFVAGSDAEKWYAHRVCDFEEAKTS